MMEPLDLPVFAAEDALVLHDRDYLLWLIHHLRAARKRVLAVQFIADLRPEADPHRDVRAVAAALAHAADRGLDVRVVLSRFVSDRATLEPNRVFARWLAPRGVGLRLYRPREGSARKDMHSKFVVIDDVWVALGSHNWTIGAFGANHEQSLALRSGDVAARLRSTFEGLWSTAEAALPEPPTDTPAMPPVDPGAPA
jgi:phosphatidylserine/phosphatidylglycerophosphate/cardiolipin synthase-like enzyme